jgi:TolB protein
VLPISGAMGDSVRAIIERDLLYSDRFVVTPLDTADASTFRTNTSGAGINYPLFSRLNVVAVVQITTVPTGLHVVLHDVAKAGVTNVTEMALPATALGRDWRMAVHRTSDEVERWVTGKPGIASTRISYMRGPSIRIVDSDGAFEITVPTEEFGSSPGWSPDGNSLVYSTFGAGSRIYMMDLATGRSRALIGPTQNILYLTPTFSPDGQSVVYARSTGDQSDLYVTSIANPSAPRRLTNERGLVNTNPIFSPDSRSVAYVSSAVGHPELYIVDADGTNNRVLTDYDFDTKNYRSDPDWSPDGRLIAYQERTKDRFQIRTIRTTGSTPKWLTSEGENEQPSWAPDGRHIVFTSTRTGVRQLWVMDVESGTMRQLTKASGSKLAAWSARLR